jgi:hypothetical protein
VSAEFINSTVRKGFGADVPFLSRIGNGTQGLGNPQVWPVIGQVPPPHPNRGWWRGRFKVTLRVDKERQ